MEKKLHELINSRTAPGQVISELDFEKLLGELDIILPTDYIEFLNTFNGCEGALNDDIYISLWSLNDLKNNNEMYEVKEFAPELFFIGSDGGDVAYALIREDFSYVEVPFIGMSLEETEYLGNNFKGFIEKIITKNISD